MSLDNDERKLLADGGVATMGGQQQVGPTQIGTKNDLQEDAPANGGGYWQFAAQAEHSRAVASGNEPSAFNERQVKEFRANAVFPDEEWKSLDNRLLEVAQNNLLLVNQLRNRGLTRTADLSTLIFEYEKAVADDPSDATVSMGLEARGQDAMPGGRQLAGVPLPIVHKSWHINARTMRTAGASGTSANINTRPMETAADGVFNTIENMLYNGWNGQVDGYSVPGLLTESNRNRFGGTDWSDTTNVTNEQVRGDILTAVEALEDDSYEPENVGYIMYLPRDGVQTLRRRRVGTDNRNSLLSEFDRDYGDFIDIEWTSNIPAGNAVMLKPVPEVLELVMASDIQNVEWSSHAGFTTHMKVMASITPLVKSDTAGQSGIVHFTIDGSAEPAA